MTSAQLFLKNGGPMFRGGAIYVPAPGARARGGGVTTTYPDLMPWLGDFRARTSAQRARARVFEMARDLVCGTSSRGLLANYDPASCCWKTFQLSLPGMEISSLATLPQWGMMRDGALYERPMPVQPTGGNDGSAWPTIVVCGNNNRAEYRTAGGDGLQTAVRRWPTPLSRDWQSGKVSPARLARPGRPLNERVMALEGGRLNPEWVETLMGFPPGWTDPTLGYTSQDVANSSAHGNRRE